MFKLVSRYIDPVIAILFALALAASWFEGGFKLMWLTFSTFTIFASGMLICTYLMQAFHRGFFKPAFWCILSFLFYPACSVYLVHTYGFYNGAGPLIVMSILIMPVVKLCLVISRKLKWV